MPAVFTGCAGNFLRHQNDKIGSGRNQREWEAGLDIPVWLPGQRAARKLWLKLQKGNWVPVVLR